MLGLQSLPFQFSTGTADNEVHPLFDLYINILKYTPILPFYEPDHIENVLPSQMLSNLFISQFPP